MPRADASATPVTAVRDRIDPLEALEAEVARAFARPPVVVSFSGGFDSSLVLTVATRVARRSGMDDPIPLTWRFTDAPRAHESEWQESVIAELGLGDWHRISATDELDWIGPVASAVLERHGLLYPANSFLHAPLLEMAGGGTLLTGIGGDQVLGLWAGRAVADVLARRRTPTARDLARMALAVMPASGRGLAARARGRTDPPNWLTRPAAAEFRRLVAAEVATEPTWWRDKLPWRVSRRDTAMSLRSLERLALAAGCEVASPLLAPPVVSALARAGGRLGAGDRSATLQRWFAPVLPRALAGRRDKALFGQAFWRESSLRFAREWEGGDSHDDLIDRSGLREEWRRPQPSALTSLLLQREWLSRRPQPASGASAPR